MATTVKAHGEDHHDHPHGWRRYVYSTNHKDIGTMYLVFALVGGLVGGVLSIVVKLSSYPVRIVQTGRVQAYALFVVVGALAFFGYYLAR
jgi:cytochrome c oxidase subunit 1